MYDLNTCFNTCQMATRIQSLEPWNGLSPALDSWIERLEEYFVMEDVETDRKRVAALLSFIGEHGYEIIKGLTSPNLPNSKSYATLKTTLTSHICPKHIVMVDRHKFNQISQGIRSVTEYLSELRKAAEHCKFGEFYDQALRDRFICGLKNDSIRKALLSEDSDLSLNNAYTKALAREQAASDSRTIGGSLESAVSANTTSSTKKGIPAWKSGKHDGKKKSSPGATCRFCKLKLTTSKCTEKFCKTVCFVCKKTGHAKKNCFQNKSRNNSNVKYTEYDSDSNNDVSILHYVDSFYDLHNVDSKPLINVFVNSSPIEMELDTGSQLTIVSRSILNGIPNLRLRPSQRVIRVANGGLVKNVSECSVNVKLNGVEYPNLIIHVVEGPFPSLFGRDWIRVIFGENWLNRFIARHVETRRKEVRSPQVTRGTVSEQYPQVKLSYCKGTVSEQLPQVKASSSVVSVTENSVTAFFEKVKESKIFDSEVGVVKDFEAELQVTQDARPVFRKARTVSYVLREGVKTDLRRQEKEGLLVKVDHSKYASPIVTVKKPDGALRICGDYKGTVNPQLDTKQYPLPTNEECFYPLRGGQKFTQLDIRQAYNQITLSESARRMLTLNTPLGLYEPTRLPYGVSSATAIFQEKMDKTLFGIPMTVCRVDDICISGQTPEEHMHNVALVVKRLEESGFRCRLDKCRFYVDQVTYLGHKVAASGIYPLEDKVETIKKASYPQNMSQLTSFLGAINYYARFIQNMSALAEPLNRLRAKGVKWEFGDEQKAAFDRLKAALSSDTVLVQYDPSLPVKIDTDASQAGLGAVISHMMPDGTERPIEFASRSLNKAEKNYGQIEKEALSLVWGVKKFHRYVYAREFELVTDHKPLLFLLGEKKEIPEHSQARIQRWALLLSSYRYKLRFRCTSNHCNADICSRFPLPSEVDNSGLQEIIEFSGRQVTNVFLTSLSYEEKPLINHHVISKYTSTDRILSKVIRYVHDGWIHNVTPELQPYHAKKNELSVEQNCLLWGARVIVPERLRTDVLDLIHACHPGIVSMKSLARSYVWWPRLCDDIETISKHCEACQQNQRKPPRTTPHPWTPANNPWERIHIDFAQLFDRQWLIVVDAYSKYPEIVDMGHNTTSAATVRELRKTFSTYGLPRVCVSDNGPQLVSEEIEEFFRKNGIEHITIPPYSPYCNGLAERMVQTWKGAMKKMNLVDKDRGKNLASWLLSYRNTPHSTTRQCPSTLMFGRPTRTRLSLLFPSKSTNSKQEQAIIDKGKYREFQVGDKVRYRDVRNKSWHEGVVKLKEGSKVYIVEGAAGEVRKHVDQIIDRYDSPSITLPDKSNDIVPTPVIPTGLNDLLAKPDTVTASPDIEHDITEHWPKPNQTDIALYPVTRSSSRISKQPEKLTYEKLGG